MGREVQAVPALVGDAESTMQRQLQRRQGAPKPSLYSGFRRETVDDDGDFRAIITHRAVWTLGAHKNTTSRMRAGQASRHRMRFRNDAIDFDNSNQPRRGVHVNTTKASEEFGHNHRRSDDSIDGGFNVLWKSRAS